MLCGIPNRSRAEVCGLTNASILVLLLCDPCSGAVTESEWSNKLSIRLVRAHKCKISKVVEISKFVESIFQKVLTKSFRAEKSRSKLLGELNFSIGGAFLHIGLH